jgi:FtsP/CotA-like multicopper oxidase with cupredoxin domain
VLDRAPFDRDNPSIPPGPARPAEAWETGGKDTVVAYPGEITRLVAAFDMPGQYVWHCHILDHEDHDMMRPMAIGKPQNPNV